MKYNYPWVFPLQVTGTSLYTSFFKIFKENAWNFRRVRNVAKNDS